MKNRLLLMLAMAALCLPAFRARAADPAAEWQQIPLPPEAAAPPAAAPATAATELKDLIARISASLKEGKNRTEADQADHLKEFDALLAKHKGETNDDVANIAFMKATLYLQIFQQTDKGAEMLKQLQHDFPDSKQAKNVDSMLANIKKGEEARKIQDSLAVQSAFPDFDVKDLDGKPMSVAAYKGKVVMLDFWATWCGPCVGEVPNVVKTYQKYHDKGFEIIGVSLDHQGDKDKLIAFTKDHNMPWRQYFDGGFWTNQLAVKYGIQSIPATFLLDTEGKIIAKNVRGEALEPAVAKALGVKYEAAAPAGPQGALLQNAPGPVLPRPLQPAAERPEVVLLENSIFPDFDVKDLDGKPMSVAAYKGKVVMLDFWATWCGPCVGEVPNVAAVYQKYHAQGFEIIGVSLDRQGDKDKLISFTKEHNMPWRQYFDGKYWQNDLAVKYGIHSIPATFLLDSSGKIIAKNVRGAALEPAVKKALGVN